MLTVPLSKIASINKALPLFIESIEGGSYIALTELDDERLPVSDADGKTITGANVSQLQSALSGYKWSSVALVQRAAYDEMIGSEKEQSPVFEIPLGWSIDNS